LYKSSLEIVETRLRKSIKEFLSLSRNIPDQVISIVVKVNLKKWARLEVERAKMKEETEKR